MGDNSYAPARTAEGSAVYWQAVYALERAMHGIYAMYGNDHSDLHDAALDAALDAYTDGITNSIRADIAVIAARQ